MRSEKRTEKQEVCYLAATMLAPLAQTASGNSWPVTLTLGAVCLGASWCLSRYGTLPGKFLSVLQGLWTCVVAALVLRWIDAYWPGHTEHWAAPLILLALAAWAAGDGARAARVGCVLLGPILILLGAVLVSGVSEIQWNYLAPSWQMADASLVPVLLLPGLTRGKGRGKAISGLLLFAVLACMVTMGVLSFPVSAETPAPVYELSRNLALFGAAQRFESLAAAAMTLGFFTVLSYLLSAAVWEGKERVSVWGKAGITACLFLLPIEWTNSGIALGSLLIFLILPALSSLKKLFEKKEKSA